MYLDSSPLQISLLQEPVQVPDELPAGREGVEQGGEAPVPGQHLTIRALGVCQGMLGPGVFLIFVVSVNP